MCKHCKNKKNMKDLRAEVSQLREMIKELEGKFNAHAVHPYPYYYTYTYNPNMYTYSKNPTWTITNGGGS